MQFAIDRTGNLVSAPQSEKLDGPYRCPECPDTLTLRKGRVLAHHFAHPAGSACALATGEGGLHWRCKHDLYQALVEAGVQDVMMERILQGVRPDVSFTAADGTRVVVEIQVSPIDFETILHRTKIYTALNAHILWVCPVETFGTPPVASDWQQLLRALYGRLYVLQEGQTVIPASLVRSSETSGKLRMDVAQKSLITSLKPWTRDETEGRVGQARQYIEIPDVQLWGHLPNPLDRRISEKRLEAVIAGTAKLPAWWEAEYLPAFRKTLAPEYRETAEEDFWGEK